MEIAALIVALLALLVAFIAWQRVKGLQEQSERLSSQIVELRSAVGDANEALENRLNELRLNMRRQSGETIFDPTMTIADAMKVHPRVSEVLANFHLGGCSHCAVSDVDTIQGACQTYGIDEAALMKALNELVSGGTGGSAGPASGVKISNVKVSF